MSLLVAEGSIHPDCSHSQQDHGQRWYRQMGIGNCETVFQTKIEIEVSWHIAEIFFIISNILKSLLLLRM